MRGRAALTETLKNNEPASDTANAAPAAPVTACMITSRLNGPFSASARHQRSFDRTVDASPRRLTRPSCARPSGCVADLVSRRGGGHEAFELAANICARWLIDELGHSLLTELLQAATHGVGRTSDGDLLDHRRTTGIPAGQVGVVEADAVLYMHAEMPLVFRVAVDDGQPVRAAGDLQHGVAPTELVAGVIGERPSGSGRRFGAGRGR